MPLNRQRDAALHIEAFLPAAGLSVLLAPLDLGVDQSAFSDNWRQSVLRFSWPALPNHTNASLNITATLQDSIDSGVTFQAGATSTVDASAVLPTISCSIPGSANGAAAGYCEMSLPPGLRGPVGLLVAVPAGTGDLRSALVTFDGYF